ncbi:LPXTG cell wall anchor domain-containing protein [Kitasatospora indigofera]|uniref:LPXTG cell wall anchor domain-containing protein n=1 Tax=Kitasatospora indigofera TaxID=67307 RepID=UPI0036953C58
MRASFTTRAAITAAAAGLLLLPAAPSALASTGTTYTVPVHQTVPVTAAGFGEHETKCGSIGTDQDGWHFVLPGNSTDFVKLTVAFDNGTPQVVTVFGPPTTKHAYVASAPGAKLTSASAEVKGGEVKWFNLSHTCPAVSSSPSPKPSTPVPSTSTSPAATSPAATVSPSATTSVTPSGSASASASTGVPSGPAATATPSTGSTVDAAAGGSPSPTASAEATGSGSLASTGANVGLTVLAALGLVGAGSVLVMRRRQAGRH